IEKLIRNRDFSAKSMINLAQSIPKESWLTEVEFADHSYLLKGASTEASLVTDFMMKLQANIYFKEVQLKKSVSSDATSNKSDFELSGRSEE
ncbi:MAG: hypothetical protein EBX52_11920, partial [Proteobacteria bacterium]|nr:hypothetical protein [Pseudomonadota bacterium]